MKHFTPERYLRLGKLEERAFLAAHEEWERALADSQRQFQHIREKLPSGLRRLIESVSLHDARIVDMVLGKRSRFTITLQPESLPTHRVVLAYSLVAQPAINKEALPESVRSEPLEWLYDELEMEEPSQAGARPLFHHDILLSNGWEVRLRFRTVTVTWPEPLIRSCEERSATLVSGSGVIG